MSPAPAGFVPCEFGGRVATCYHTPRCGWQVPGDWLSPFGRWAGSAAGPCGHSRGAINWDTGAWHCDDCGADVDDDGLAEAVADELRGLASVGATVDPQAVAARVRNDLHGR